MMLRNKPSPSHCSFGPRRSAKGGLARLTFLTLPNRLQQLGPIVPCTAHLLADWPGKDSHNIIIGGVHHVGPMFFFESHASPPTARTGPPVYSMPVLCLVPAPSLPFDDIGSAMEKLL